jgi:outer membrane receptor protein involved in Fe transport
MGYKGNLNNVGLFITAFYAKVNEQGGYEATTQKVIENHYQSAGLEIELAARLTKQIDIRGGLTYTSAKITDGANNGNKPRRQAPFIFNLVPTFTSKNLSIGFSAIGTSSSFAQDDNKLKFKGYVMINPFVNYRFGKSMMASINANNIGNTLGITEAEEGSITEGKSNIIRARSITGRTISATVLFNF